MDESFYLSAPKGVNVMRDIAKKIQISALARVAALAVATTGLGGCATLYDNYYDNGYYDNAYSDYNCDPYSPFDNYYDCDSRLGFYNFGYSGGWYNNYYYPGFGLLIYDRGGRRYDMDNNHRRYWGSRRHEYWQQNNRYHGNNRGRHGYGSSGRPGNYQQIAWPEQNGGRVSDGEHRRRDGDGRQHGHRDGRHSDGNNGYRNDASRDGRPNNDGYGRRGGRVDRQAQPATVPNASQQSDQPAPLRHPRNGNVNSGRSEGDYGNRGRGRDYTASSVQQQSAPAQQVQAPRSEQRAQPRSEPRPAPSHPRSPGKMGGYGGNRRD
jgi:hypothetical protein